VGVLLTPYILRWMGTDPSVLPQSEAYFRWYFAGAAAIVMYNALKGILTALGDSRRPLYYLIFSSVLNVILDLIFVALLKGGVAAAAIATGLSQGISALLCLAHLLERDQIYTLRTKEFRIDGPVLREIVKIGLPTGIQMSVISIANVMVQKNINSFGADAMAACGSYAKVEGFVFLPITCFSLALTTFIGQNLGAGRYDRVKAGSRFGLWASVLTAEAILYSGFARMGAEDLFQKARKALGQRFLSMCVTPKDIDAMVKDGAAILSYGLNLALFGEKYGALEGLMR
jgi:putative MATE family efflux protein